MSEINNPIVDTISFKVTIAFKKITKDSAFYSKLIGWKTNSKYSHVELIIDDKWISSVEGRGVHIKKLKPLKDTYDYYSLPIITLTDTQHFILWNWIYEQRKSKYDTYGIIFSQILPLRFESRDKWFCSEIVTKILQLLLVPEVLNLHPHLQSPGDLAKIFNLE